MKSASLTARLSVLLACLVVSACASKDGAVKQQGSGGGGGSSMEQRMTKWDMSKRSHYERSLGTAKGNKGFKTSNFHRQKDFHTGEAFSGGDDRFNAGSFAQSDQPSRDRGKVFSGNDERSRLGETSYKTGESRFNREAARDGDKESSQADDVFRTFDNRTGTRARENSQRPVIEDKPGDYTEGQIRSLLNKG